jgi:hypothetical protein
MKHAWRMHGIEWRELPLLIEAIALVAAIRLGLALVTIGTLRRGLALAARRTGRRSRAHPAERIAWAVTAARVPGATCLTRALAAETLLGRRRIPARLRIGISRGARGLDGHAWVESEGRIVVGGAELAGRAPLAPLDIGIR